MTAQQRRLLSASNSKLGKVDIAVRVHTLQNGIPLLLTIKKEILRQDGAWSRLPRETRADLCALLPTQLGVEHDPDLNPMWGSCAPHIEKELRAWQENLREGRETQKWKTEAMQAGQDRRSGKFDEWKQRKREDFQSRQQTTTTVTPTCDSLSSENKAGAQLDDTSASVTSKVMTVEDTIQEEDAPLESNEH